MSCSDCGREGCDGGCDSSAASLAEQVRQAEIAAEEEREARERLEEGNETIYERDARLAEEEEEKRWEEG